MKYLNKTAEAIFRKIIAMANGESYLKLDAGGFMAAIFEKLNSYTDGKLKGDVWSVAHYFEQNGDLCSDPEMTFLVGDAMILPMSFTMNGTVLERNEQSVTIEGDRVKYKPRMQKDHTAFANQWMVNIKNQQLTSIKKQAALPAPKIEPAEVGNVKLVDYSEKAVAVFGDTKPIKDDLKKIGGRFNPHLTQEGSKVPGWIFSKNKLADLKNLLSL